MYLFRLGRALAGDDASIAQSSTDNDIDVPEEVENVFEELFAAVQDRVRPIDLI